MSASIPDFDSAKLYAPRDVVKIGDKVFECCKPMQPDTFYSQIEVHEDWLCLGVIDTSQTPSRITTYLNS